MKHVKKIISALGIVVLAGCQAGGNAVGERDTLVVAYDGEPVSLDPQAVNDFRSGPVIFQIFDRLLNQDEYGNFYPSLAVEWRRIDDLTYEFDLREGVYFHDGTRLQASDVVFSLQRAAEAPTVAPILGMIDADSVYAVDENTVRVGTEYPFVPLLAHLSSHHGASIVSQAAVENLGEAFGNNPVGTGAFKVSNWYHGDRLELVRFEDYHGEAPAFDWLVFRNIPDAANRLIELETGQADLLINVSPSDVAAISNHPDLNLHREEALRAHYIGFNTQRAPFDDVRVRHAINYAVDVDLIIETILEGVGVRMFGPIGSLLWGAHPNLPAYGFDVEHARQLLAEAGLEDGFTTTIITDQDNNNRNIAEVLQNKLQEIGITAVVESVEWPTFLEVVNSGNHEIFITGWTGATRDADYGLYPLFHSDHLGTGGNRAFYVNPEVDALLEAARRELDPEQRRAMYYEIQEIIVADAPWVFMNVGEVLVGARGNIGGLRNLNHLPYSQLYFTD